MKKTALPIILVSIVLGVGIFYSTTYVISKKSNVENSYKTIEVKTIETKLMADGTVRSQDEVNLHFLTGGKLVYAPLKEGDKVVKGQTIASVDSFTVQKQIEAAINTAKAAEASYDQTKADAKNDVSKQKLIYPYNYYKLADLDGEERENAIDTAVKHLLEQSKTSKDNAAIQVEIAKYALTFSTLNAPFSGVIVHEDTTTPGVIVSPQTTYTVINPNNLVFRANISEDKIAYINIGSKAMIKLNDANQKTIEGNVTKIYPDKVTLQNGENVYQVEVTSKDLRTDAKYKQNGVVFIDTNNSEKVMLVPSWTILNNKYIWTDNNGTPELKDVETGNTNGDYVEIRKGISSDTKVITNPKSVVSKKYIVL